MHEAIRPSTEAIGAAVVDAAIAVHRVLGPGLLESAYEACLAYELESRSLRVARQKALPLIFKGVSLDAGYRIDLMVDDDVVVEVKSVSNLLPIHEAQILTYLRLSNRRLGFLINFNVPLIKHGLRRIAL